MPLLRLFDYRSTTLLQIYNVKKKRNHNCVKISPMRKISIALSMLSTEGQPKTYQIMKTRQTPITEPRMMTSRFFLRLILFTKLLIRGNLLDRSFNLV